MKIRRTSREPLLKLAETIVENGYVDNMMVFSRYAQHRVRGVDLREALERHVQQTLGVVTRHAYLQYWYGKRWGGVDEDA